ncbi:Kelch repeat-containing protein [Brevibacillus choshinensis]|uniref:Galactose oxidase n=1 Tax=Brevibacillus choshinensis TaxID=54911 RepID=A0ABX7FR20_BRECH|nr:hypothetical protein [Brevibacillus choshinensis]QRG68612.1 hypothetical protein JNE38_05525 [Brevibacillus choshinensis]
MDAVAFALAKSIKVSDDVLIKKSNMPLAFKNGGAGGVNGKAYVFAGETASAIVANHYEYDPATDTYAVKDGSPGGLKSRGSCASLTKVYSIGGAIGSMSGDERNLIYEYDPTTNIWTSKALMPIAMRGPGVAYNPADRMIYVAGDSKLPMYQYDPSKNVWATKAQMAKARSGNGLAAVGGKLLATGGIGDNDYTAELYNPITNSWSPAANMPRNRRWHTSMGIGDNAYLFGGYDDFFNTNDILNVHIYNVVENKWTFGTTTISDQAMGMMPALIGDKIYTFGGSGYSSSTVQSLCYEYTPRKIDGLDALLGWLAAN